VPGVAGGLLEQVHQHPAEARRRPWIRPPAQLVEVGPAEGHLVHRLPSLAVGIGRGPQGVVRRPGPWRLRFPARKAAQHPGDLGVRHVPDKPQQAGAAGHGRPAGRLLVQVSDLAQQRLAPVLKQGVQGLRLAAGQARRLAIGHIRKLRRRGRKSQARGLDQPEPGAQNVVRPGRQAAGTSDMGWA
jgi:hypothetical protein